MDFHDAASQAVEQLVQEINEARAERGLQAVAIDLYNQATAQKRALFHARAAADATSEPTYAAGGSVAAVEEVIATDGTDPVLPDDQGGQALVVDATLLEAARPGADGACTAEALLGAMRSCRALAWASTAAASSAAAGGLSGSPSVEGLQLAMREPPSGLSANSSTAALAALPVGATEQAAGAGAAAAAGDDRPGRQWIGPPDGTHVAIGFFLHRPGSGGGAEGLEGGLAGATSWCFVESWTSRVVCIGTAAASSALEALDQHQVRPGIDLQLPSATAEDATLSITAAAAVPGWQVLGVRVVDPGSGLTELLMPPALVVSPAEVPGQSGPSVTARAAVDPQAASIRLQVLAARADQPFGYGDDADGGNWMASLQAADSPSAGGAVVAAELTFARQPLGLPPLLSTAAGGPDVSFDAVVPAFFGGVPVAEAQELAEDEVAARAAAGLGDGDGVAASAEPSGEGEPAPPRAPPRGTEGHYAPFSDVVVGGGLVSAGPGVAGARGGIPERLLLPAGFRPQLRGPDLAAARPEEGGVGLDIPLGTEALPLVGMAAAAGQLPVAQLVLVAASEEEAAVAAVPAGFQALPATDVAAAVSLTLAGAVAGSGADGAEEEAKSPAPLDATPGIRPGAVILAARRCSEMEDGSLDQPPLLDAALYLVDLGPAADQSAADVSQALGREAEAPLEAALQAARQTLVGYDVECLPLVVGDHGVGLLLATTSDEESAAAAWQAARSAAEARGEAGEAGRLAAELAGRSLHDLQDASLHDMSDIHEPQLFDADPAEEARRRAEEEELSRRQQLDLERQRLEEAIGASEEQRDILQASNDELQKRLSRYFSIREAGDAASRQAGGRGGGGGAAAAGAGGGAATAVLADTDKEKRYRDHLQNLKEARHRALAAERRAVGEGTELRAVLDAKEAGVERLGGQFGELRDGIVRQAVFARTGRKLPKEELSRVGEEEAAMDARVRAQRLRFIRLRTGVARLQEQLRAKENVGEGLHLIDFEQLKIENATLHEKIEDRQEELRKLRAKATTTVQVLTHVKEKLQFVRRKVERLRVESEEVEVGVAGARARIAKQKRDRDRVRNQNDQRRAAQGFAHDDAMAVDFDQCKRSVHRLSQRLAQLKDKHRALHGETTANHRRANVMSRGGPGLSPASAGSPVGFGRSVRDTHSAASFSAAGAAAARDGRAARL